MKTMINNGFSAGYEDLRAPHQCPPGWSRTWVLMANIYGNMIYRCHDESYISYIQQYKTTIHGNIMEVI